MRPPVAVTTKIALVAAAIGLLFLIPYYRGTATAGDGVTWTGGIFLLLAAVTFVAAFFGAGAEVDLLGRGLTAAAEVVEAREEQRTVKGETFMVWRTWLRYRDVSGDVHDVDFDCDKYEHAILEPGRSTTVKYHPDYPHRWQWVAPERPDEVYDGDD